MVEGKGFGPSTSRLSAYLAEISRRQTALECPLEPFRVPIRPHFRGLGLGDFVFRQASRVKRRARPPAISGAGFQLARMKREVLTHVQLHSIDLGQEPACR